MSLLKELEANLPKDAKITEAKFEGSEMVLYTKNKEFFRESDDVVREIVSNLKKRIEIRPDSSITLEPEKAKKIIEEIVPADANIKAIYFEPELGKVVIESAKPGLVIGKGGLIKDHTIGIREVLPGAVERREGLAVIKPNFRHNAPALRFDEYLSFIANVGANGLFEMVVSADKPFAVPAMLEDNFSHIVRLAGIFSNLVFLAKMLK